MINNPVNAARIYIADIAPLTDDRLYNDLYSRVSAERRAKTDAMRLKADKMRSLGAEYLLMHACCEYGIDYYAEEIRPGESSKPEFSFSPFCFNLSHSGDRVMCIISDLQCGCDVERLKAANMKVAERFFAAEEAAALHACTADDEQNSLFYRLWTLKESFIKCTGAGFRTELNSFSVSVGNGGITVKTEKSDNPAYKSAHSYIFGETRPEDGYRYSWCLKAHDGITPQQRISWVKIR